MPGNETLIVRLAPELKAKAQRYAKLKHTTLSQVVREALVKFVADEEAAEAAALSAREALVRSLRRTAPSADIVGSGGFDIPSARSEPVTRGDLEELLFTLLERREAGSTQEQAEQELNPETENG